MASLSEASEEVAEEVRNFKKCLIRMAEQAGESLVFWETSLSAQYSRAKVSYSSKQVASQLLNKHVRKQVGRKASRPRHARYTHYFHTHVLAMAIPGHGHRVRTAAEPRRTCGARLLQAG